MVHLFAKNSDLDKVEKEIEDWVEGDLFDLADEMYSNSDNKDDKDDWDDTKNDLDKGDLIEYILEFFKKSNLSYGDLQSMKKAL